MNTSNKPTNDNLFLPNFCDVYTVFLGIIVTELLAFVFVLAPLSKTGYNWIYLETNFITDFAMVSLFTQWVTLTSMGLLCLVRRWLRQIGNDIIVAFISYLLILMVTFGVSEVAWRLNEFTLFLDFAAHHKLFLWRNMGISAIFMCYITGKKKLRRMPTPALKRYKHAFVHIFCLTA